MMEAENPRPVHHRIPNFVGAAEKGFAELEYAMLRYMGAIDDNTPVVTSIHDRQLVDGIPVEKLLIHDVPVDFICTPTQVIFTKTSRNILGTRVTRVTGGNTYHYTTTTRFV